ncbi:hypothetical protein GIB67_027629 [Kingdonia uniflora]|uniref:Dolichyl-diphosphooligosaccharide--protein glycosyltransferase subunit 1 n=1 Tax=Kingdonia uniflora TaxID=39325 RepID=A0A7J7NKS0_9MAGN|nr:hypothetical protein GIB67_027629 [Kingdonia uniflora]
MAPNLRSTSSIVGALADDIAAQLALMREQFAQVEERHTNHLRYEREARRQELKNEHQRRVEETDRHHRDFEELHNSVCGLQQARAQDALARSRGPDSSRISARARLGPNPQTKVPPVHLGVDGISHSIPEGLRLCTLGGVSAFEDSSDSTLRTTRPPNRRPTRERLEWIVKPAPGAGSWARADSNGGFDLLVELLCCYIDLSSHIVRVFLTLKVENSGASPASEVLLAFPPTKFEHLSLVKAASVAGKRKKKAYTPLSVNPTKVDDAPNETKFYAISLLKPLNPGETTTLEVLYVLTHSLEPFPAEIKQSESQLVYYRDSAIILSPYPVKEQTTYIKTPSTRVESYTRVEPSNRVGTELKYGEYVDRAPYSFSPVIVHFENNHPFSVVEELLREVEISHWGSVQITESYKLVHAGARHKGVFSRVEYQSKPSISGVSSFKHLLARLPPRVHSVYYRDGIGNISTSHLRSDSKKSEFEIEPRYPLFGGWRATFVIGYGVPLQDFLFESFDGRRYLNFSFGCPLVDTVVDKLTLKVVLPEGAQDPSAVVPFPVEQHLETSYSYLDVVGRTVVVLEKENVSPDHNLPFQVIFLQFPPLTLYLVFGLLQIQPNFHACRAVDVGNCIFPIFCCLCCLPTHRSLDPQIINQYLGILLLEKQSLKLTLQNL